MIAFVRVVNIRPGKTGAAMAFAKEVSKHIKAQHNIDLEVLRPIGGNPQRVAWSTRYADLAAMEAFTGKLLADARYWELVNTASECFLPGSMYDSIWQTS